MQSDGADAVWEKVLALLLLIQPLLSTHVAVWVLLWQDRFGGNKENSSWKNFYASGGCDSLSILCSSPEAGSSSS